MQPIYPMHAVEPQQSVQPRSPRPGFSLLELVVVLMIIAILAGLLVSVVGWVRRSANYASGANNQSTIMANFELFRTTFGNNSYPDRLDSLLTASETVPTYMNADLAGMITPGAFADSQEFDSINKGLTRVMDHTDTLAGALEGNPGNTGTIVRPITAASTMAFVNAGTTNGRQLLTSLGYVNATTGLPELPTGIRLVLLGVGPSHTAIGRTMQSSPFDTNVDTSAVYNRFIAVFAVYSPREGRRAQLKAVLCPRGRIINRNLSEFYQSTNPD